MALRETPRPNNFQLTVDHLNGLKTESGQSYQTAILQLQGIINGSDVDGIKAQYYSEWTIEDLEDLLAELDEPTN